MWVKILKLIAINTCCGHCHHLAQTDTSFIWEKTTLVEPNSKAQSFPNFQKLTSEVQATLTVIKRRDYSTEQEWQRIELQNTNLRRAKLDEANLIEADLTGANLIEADLTGANLFGANLPVAWLYKANLSGANLSGARLYGAVLSGANLSEADLTKANLSGANLSGANLTQEQISVAITDEKTKFPNHQIAPTSLQPEPLAPEQP